MRPPEPACRALQDVCPIAAAASRAPSSRRAHRARHRPLDSRLHAAGAPWRARAQGRPRADAACRPRTPSGSCGRHPLPLPAPLGRARPGPGARRPHPGEEQGGRPRGDRRCGRPGRAGAAQHRRVHTRNTRAATVERPRGVRPRSRTAGRRGGTCRGSAAGAAGVAGRRAFLVRTARRRRAEAEAAWAGYSAARQALPA
jgi:hypothetical protein